MSSLPQVTRTPSASLPARKHTRPHAPAKPTRRPSLSALPTATGPKTQRTSKTSQKLVVLPIGPQTRPLPGEDNEDDATHGYETDTGVVVRDYKNEGERMSKDQRKKAGFKRLTVYCVADSFKMKLLASFLKREHNVSPRVYDEAMYVMYHLPLLPGYGPNSNLRSSAPPSQTLLNRMSEAEENGYQGTYFTSQTPETNEGGYIQVASPKVSPHLSSEIELEPETETETEQGRAGRDTPCPKAVPAPKVEENVAEVIFFSYGVVALFGMQEGEERSVLEDVENAGVMVGKFREDDLEVEEFHYVHDPNIVYPRIYNDFFTFKSPSHLLKISIAHAVAQSTLLAHYESVTHRVLSAPATLSIPRQLASTGALTLRRTEALKLTGRLFKLKRDVNLMGNVLDVPELFWDEASLGELYESVREYMEVEPRVGVLNEKLGVASDLLNAIHNHLNNSAMERITWIVIWLIVAACLVEMGEVLARLVVHATMGKKRKLAAAAANALSREEVLRALEGIMVKSPGAG
ncbi:DUF155-domain-containing protein [Neolentinus lepideus HHB14362 ss-1]|uniref:DUF155-domain-containing protein n=1 Tax=Neolentinus lepideus HHB14362 ss-1 TaxID=1314782 RepID=A0A165REC0_9AGAM|nr:DUF155-domain-containing protein [Neolentinus lepideus HHB14362 ss-1]